MAPSTTANNGRLRRRDSRPRPGGRAIRQRRRRRPATASRPAGPTVQLPAGDAEPADRPFLVQTDEQLADRVVHLGEAVEPPVPQAPQQPALVGDLLWNRQFNRSRMSQQTLTPPWS